MPETYETCSYSVPPSVRFKALSEKYGDTAYNRPLAPFSHTVYCNEFSGIDIFSDRDFDRLERPARRLPDRERNLISGGIPAGERDALRTRCGGDVYARPFRTIPEIHDSPRDKKTHGYRRPAGTGNGDNGKYGNHFPIEITHPSERLWLPICRRKGKKPIFVERQSLKNTGL